MIIMVSDVNNFTDAFVGAKIQIYQSNAFYLYLNDNLS